MGSQVSRDTGFDAQLHFYKDACKTYPDVKIFEDLKERALAALPSEGFSLQFLQNITSCFLDVDQNVAKLILENKKYIWNSPDLKEIVKEYFDSSLETLRFCEELENCLKRARSEQLKLQIALQHIAPQGSRPGKEHYGKIVEKLNDFKTAPNPFTWDFFLKLDTLQNRHSQMLKTLDAKRTQLEKKGWWIKCWGIIYGATLTAAVICCCAVVIIVPGLAALAVTASFTAADSFSLIAVYQSQTNKRQLEGLKAMENGTYAKLEDLKAMRVRVESLVNSHHSIVQNVELCLGGEDALLIAVEDVKREHLNFMSQSQNLIDHVAECSQRVGLLRNLVLCGITQTPGKS